MVTSLTSCLYPGSTAVILAGVDSSNQSRLKSPMMMVWCVTSDVADWHTLSLAIMCDIAVVKFVKSDDGRLYRHTTDRMTSSLEKQTPTLLEFYFRFRSRPFARNVHFIMHQHAEFRPNRSTHCGNITSYRFIKMTAADAEYYLRFHICWYCCLQKVSEGSNEQTKFRRNISISGWDITTSVCEKK